MTNKFLSKYDLAKILVGGQQYGFGMIRHFKNFAIRNTGDCVNDIKNSVSFDAQAINDLAIDTLVGKEVHTVAPSAG